MSQIDAKRRRLESPDPSQMTIDSEITHVSASPLDTPLDTPSDESTASMITQNILTQTTQPLPSLNSGTTATQSQERVCGVCRQSIVSFDDSKWIRCHNNCGIDYHVTCVGLNQRVREMLLRRPSIKWICHSCVDKGSQKRRPLLNIV